MPLLNEISSWVNFRAILNQFPQKMNVSFIHLQDRKEKNSESLRGWQGQLSCFSLDFVGVESQRKPAILRAPADRSPECENKGLANSWYLHQKLSARVF